MYAVKNVLLPVKINTLSLVFVAVFSSTLDRMYNEPGYFPLFTHKNPNNYKADIYTPEECSKHSKTVQEHSVHLYGISHELSRNF